MVRRKKEKKPLSLTLPAFFSEFEGTNTNRRRRGSKIAMGKRNGVRPCITVYD
jgi:hypothetical protein